MNTFTGYEHEVLRTAPNDLNNKDMLLLGALGLAGEVGEYAEMIKKHLYHGHPLDRNKAIEELGDIAWYLVYAANSLKTSLGEATYRNSIKLRKRYPTGFSSDKSLNREEWR